MRFSYKSSGLFVFGLIAGMFMHITHSWAEEATLLPVFKCETVAEFATRCSLGTYCCPNGLYKTTTSCPSGWILDAATNTCTRATVTATDAAGSYTETYGTCAPTTTNVECCTESIREIDGEGSCYTCTGLL